MAKKVADGGSPSSLDPPRAHTHRDGGRARLRCLPMVAVAALLAASSCTNTLDIPEAGPLRVDLLDLDGLVADGVSSFRIVVEISGSREAAVQYEVTNGRLEGAGDGKKLRRRAAAAGPRAAVDTVRVEVGTKVDPVHVSVAAGGLRVDTMARPDFAYAERIRGESTLFRVPTDGSKAAELVAILARESGRVSEMVPVRFRAFQVGAADDTTDVGRFIDRVKAVTDSTGVARIKLLLDTPDVASDTVWVQMSTPSGMGAEIALPRDSLVKLVPVAPEPEDESEG